MPNPDGSMTPEERKSALLGTAAVLPTTKREDAATTGISGDYGNSGTLNVQNAQFGNLNDAQAIVKRGQDFGLGSGNNAQTAAMLGNAQATGDKYSQAFGADADAAHAYSQAAAGRGIQPFQGDTGNYQTGVRNALVDRGKQQDAYGSLMNFAQQGPGPSAAQAQLTQATDANTQNALALARSGRGMGGSAAGLRQAAAQNAVTQQQAAGQMGELRANENTAFQAQRLNAYNAAGGVANSLVGADQGTAASGLAGAQYQTNTALSGTQLNDATSQAWSAQQQAAQQQGLGSEMGAQTQELNVNASALAGRESEWASANQAHGIDTGNATQAGIADANRTQAYIGAGAAAGGAIIAAASDQNAKTNIQPLSSTPGTVTALPSQAPAPQGAALASKSAADAAQKSATGSAVGGAAGSVAGGAIGTLAGPVGTAVGAAVGNIAGKALGKVFSDVRNKTNIQPLTAVGQSLQAGGGALLGQKQDPYAQLLQKYGAAPVQPAGNAQAVKDYSKVPTKSFPDAGVVPTARFADVKGSQQGVFSRSTDHPILSEGDALLADSARGAPPSSYQYKDPSDGQGTYVGPMAQDLAANPVTAPAVSAGPDGKLQVDGARASLAALSQNHSQQNQLDALYAMLPDDAKKKAAENRAAGASSRDAPILSRGDSLAAAQ